MLILLSLTECKIAATVQVSDARFT